MLATREMQSVPLRIRGIFLLVSCLLATAGGTSFAATRFVSNHGVDGPTCGDAATPCRSITRGITNAVAGDTIEVGPGRYGDVDFDGAFSSPGDEPAEIAHEHPRSSSCMSNNPTPPHCTV